MFLCSLTITNTSVGMFVILVREKIKRLICILGAVLYLTWHLKNWKHECLYYPNIRLNMTIAKHSLNWEEMDAYIGHPHCKMDHFDDANYDPVVRTVDKVCFYMHLLTSQRLILLCYRNLRCSNNVRDIRVTFIIRRFRLSIYHLRLKIFF